MLRDKKNIDFRDQIYYALANLLMREGNRDEGKDNYRLSVAASYKKSVPACFVSYHAGKIFILKTRITAGHSLITTVP